MTLPSRRDVVRIAIVAIALLLAIGYLSLVFSSGTRVPVILVNCATATQPLPPPLPSDYCTNGYRP